MDVLKRAIEEFEVCDNPYQAHIFYASKETLHRFAILYNMRFRITYKHKREKMKYRRKGTTLRTLGFKRRQT